MSTADMTSQTATESAAPPKPGEMRLEVVLLPVSDIDRAKAFYAKFQTRESKGH